jgi:putative membrane protein
VRWPRRRWAAFALGVALFGWATGGALQVFAASLLWVWVTQVLVLLLVVPVLLLAGRPMALAGEFFAGEPRLGGARLRGWVISPPVGRRAVAAGRCRRRNARGRAVGGDPGHPGIAGGWPGRRGGDCGAAVGCHPGIVLRLQTKPASTYFLHRLPHPWSPTPLHDQQLAGGVLWTVAEVLDLPFLILLFVVWIRADAREAADIDAALAAQRNARAAVSPTPAVGAPTLGPADTPWWLTDPQLRGRYRDQT